MKRSLLLLAALSIAAPALVSTERAYAQSKEDLDKAKALFNAGAQAYSLGQYLPAIQAFEEAYKIAPKPAILFSLAQAQRKQYVIDKDPTRLEAAVKGFRQYLAEVASGGRRADAVQALSELEPLLEAMKAKGMPAPTAAPAVKPAARVMVTSPTTGAVVSLDGASTSEAPFIGEVKPGKHAVTVKAKGFTPEKRDVQLFPGGVLALDFPLKELPALLSVDAPAGAEITVDGQVVGVTPLASPVPLTHGRHFLAVMRNGALAWTRDVDVVHGETTTVQASLATSTQRKIAWAFFGTSVAGLATGGVFGLLSVGRDHAAQDILDARAVGNISRADLDDYDRARRDRDRYRTFSAISLGVGATAAVVGSLLWWLDRPSAPMREGAPLEKKPGVKPTVELGAMVGPGTFGGTFDVVF